MTDKNKKYIILQTVAPDYRSKFYNFLSNHLGQKFSILAGSEYFQKTIKTDENIAGYVKIINFYLFNRAILFQYGMWRAAIGAQVLIVELNPRIISNWILLIFRKIIRKKTIVWGHLWSRKGKTSPTNILRKIMRLISDKTIVYTLSQMRELELAEPSISVDYAPNAIYQKDETTSPLLRPESEINNLIYVGRLVPSKKPMLLLKAFHNSIMELAPEVKLYIIGEGPEKQKIQDYCKTHQLLDRVYTPGHLNDYNALSEFYSSSIFSISPGYVGLSITQSLWFGVPMLISKQENHSPEIELAKEEFNALYFDSDNERDLKEKIISIFNNRSKWYNRRDQISQNCTERYSIEAMAGAFIKSFQNNA